MCSAQTKKKKRIRIM